MAHPFGFELRPAGRRRFSVSGWISGGRRISPRRPRGGLPCLARPVAAVITHGPLADVRAVSSPRDGAWLDHRRRPGERCGGVGAATGAWFALVANDRTCPAAVLSARPRSASVGSAGGVADAVLVLVKAGTSVAAYDSCISVIPVSYGATLIARYDLRGAGHGFRHCRPDDSQRGEDR